jgi:cytochrome c
MTETMTARAHAWRPIRRLRWLAVAVLSIFVVLGVVADAGQAATGDAQRGQKVFQQCYACHFRDAGESNLQGPNLAGVVGRTAGTLATFPDYSEAMKAAGRGGLVWNVRTLDAFLEDPARMVPDTSMSFIGLRSKADRDDVIAYLQTAPR